MTTQKRLVVIFTLLFALLALGLVLYFRTEHAHLSMIKETELEHRRVAFENILHLKRGAVLLLAKDYSYWDEMVDAIRSRDTEWARINVDSGIRTYGADGAWIYDLRGERIYSVNRFGDERIDHLGLTAEQMRHLLDGQSPARFFIKTAAGYLEVHGATVHPSDDSARLTPAQGYFLVGKLWSPEYVASLSSLVRSDIRLSSADDLGGWTDQYGFFVIFHDQDRTPLFAVFVKPVLPVLEHFQSQSRILIQLFIFYTCLQMLIVLYFMRRYSRRIVAG